jgi:hypothetical protein
LTRTATARPPQSSVIAAQAADRAASFTSGVTESSRSITISSAGSDRALASIFAEEAGTERQERRDLNASRA